MNDHDKHPPGILPVSATRLSRRQVLVGGAAATALVSGAGAFLAGTRPAAAEEPRQGGRLRLGVTDTSTDETLDLK